MWPAIQVHRRPLLTVAGYSTVKRREWVRPLMSERRDILAVQTLRNWIMASSFLATTAILMASGALHFLTNVPQRPELLHKHNLLGSTGPALLLRGHLRTRH